MKNKKTNIYIIPLFIVFLIFIQGNTPEWTSKIHPLIQVSINSNPEEKFLVWIQLTDKGKNTKELLNHPELFLTERSLLRRAKVSPGKLIDITDLPVSYAYIKSLKNNGITIKNVSKWFNSVSCYINKNQLEDAAKLPFVKSITPVAVFNSDKYNKILLSESHNIQNLGLDNPSDINYGNSLQQSLIINIPEAHNHGFFGQNVLIAQFDAGVDNLSHPAFDSLRARNLRTYDFVNNDTIVGNQPGQMGSGSHGTLTLSLVGGYSPGNLVSPAFRSNYIIAKTENTDSETPQEEDNWIAAAEWADSLGADIITCSLGYREMDPGSAYSYDWTWMNGDSIRVTIAADLAVNKGIIVVNSAGNFGVDNTHNTLNAPADGDSVLTVGSIGFNGNRSNFSSVGPTVDGRIKPDVMALGENNVMAMTGEGNTGFFTSATGTSLSTPMVAGVCALMLSANPYLTPMQVVNIIRSNSSNANSPNRFIGWGTVNAWESVKDALELLPPQNIPEAFVLQQNYPNPFNPSTIVPFVARNAGTVSLEVYDTRGRRVAVLTKFALGGPENFTFNASRFGLSTGVYLYRISGSGFATDSKKMVLLK